MTCSSQVANEQSLWNMALFQKVNISLMTDNWGKVLISFLWEISMPLSTAGTKWYQLGGIFLSLPTPLQMSLALLIPHPFSLYCSTFVFLLCFFLVFLSLFGFNNIPGTQSLWWLLWLNYMIDINSFPLIYSNKL